RAAIARAAAELGALCPRASSPRSVPRRAVAESFGKAARLRHASTARALGLVDVARPRHDLGVALLLERISERRGAVRRGPHGATEPRLLEALGAFHGAGRCTRGRGALPRS